MRRSLEISKDSVEHSTSRARSRGPSTADRDKKIQTRRNRRYTSLVLCSKILPANHLRFFPAKSQSTVCNLHTVGPCLQFSRFTAFLTAQNQSVALPLPALAPHQATDMHQQNKTNREKKRKKEGGNSEDESPPSGEMIINMSAEHYMSKGFIKPSISY